MNDRPPPFVKGLNTAEKVCAILVLLLGVVFVIQGVLGVFMEVRANYTLPPVIGALPFFLGYGMIRCVMIAFKVSR
jgi:hypothetical protein